MSKANLSVVIDSISSIDNGDRISLTKLNELKGNQTLSLKKSPSESMLKPLQQDRRKSPLSQNLDKDLQKTSEQSLKKSSSSLDDKEKISNSSLKREKQEFYQSHARSSSLQGSERSSNGSGNHSELFGSYSSSAASQLIHDNQSRLTKSDISIEQAQFNDTESIFIPMGLDQQEKDYLEKQVAEMSLTDLESKSSFYDPNENSSASIVHGNTKSKSEVPSSSSADHKETYIHQKEQRRPQRHKKHLQEKQFKLSLESFKFSSESLKEQNQFIKPAESGSTHTKTSSMEIGDDGEGETDRDSSRSKAKTKFLKLFPELEKDLLIEVFNCAYEKDFLWQGKIYLTDNHIAFYAKIFGKVKRVMINYHTIEMIQKKSTVGLIPNVIKISTNEPKKYSFTSFVNRDAAYTYMFNAWKSKSLYQQQTAAFSPNMSMTGRFSSLSINQSSSSQDKKAHHPDQSAGGKGLSISYDSSTLLDQIKSDRLSRNNHTASAHLSTVEELHSNQDISDPTLNRSTSGDGLRSEDIRRSSKADLNSQNDVDLQTDFSPKSRNPSSPYVNIDKKPNITINDEPQDLNKSFNSTHTRRKSQGRLGHSTRTASMSASMNDFFKRVFASSSCSPSSTAPDLLSTKLTEDTILVKSKMSPKAGGLPPVPNAQSSSPKSHHAGHSVPDITPLNVSEHPASVSLNSLKSGGMAETVIQSKYSSAILRESAIPTVACQCATHPEKNVLTIIVDLPVSEVYEKLFGDPKAAVLIETHLKRFSADNFEVGDWKVPDQGGHLCREIKYQISVKVPLFGKQQSPATEKQVLLIKEELKRYIVEITTRTPKVPYGDTFLTVTRYCLTNEGQQKTKVNVNMRIDFMKKTIWKDKIETGAYEGATAFIKEYISIASKDSIEKPGEFENTTSHIQNVSFASEPALSTSSKFHSTAIHTATHRAAMQETMNNEQGLSKRLSLAIISVLLFTTILNTFWIIYLQQQIQTQRELVSPSITKTNSPSILGNKIVSLSNVERQFELEAKRKQNQQEHADLQKRELDHAQQSIEQIYHQLSSMNQVLEYMKSELNEVLQDHTEKENEGSNTPSERERE